MLPRGGYRSYYTDPDTIHRLAWLAQYKSSTCLAAPTDIYLSRPPFVRSWDVPEFLPGYDSDTDHGDIPRLGPPVDTHDLPLSQLSISPY